MYDKNMVQEELILRDANKTGKLGFLSYLEILCLAYVMKII